MNESGHSAKQPSQPSSHLHLSQTAPPSAMGEYIEVKASSSSTSTTSAPDNLVTLDNLTQSTIVSDTETNRLFCSFPHHTHTISHLSSVCLGSVCLFVSQLQALKERYTKDTIYTYVGDILLAINPLKQLGIYNKKHQQEYVCTLSLCARRNCESDCC